MRLVGRIANLVATLMRRTGRVVRPCLAPVPLVAGRPSGRFGPAYALEFRVSPNVWIVRSLHL